MSLNTPSEKSAWKDADIYIYIYIYEHKVKDNECAIPWLQVASGDAFL
jgi:hypothetical protein